MKTARAIVGFVVLAAVLTVVFLIVGEDDPGSRVSGPTPSSSAPASAPSASASPVPPEAAAPAVPSSAEEAWVDYVHDGDTLFFTDGRKVRLLGIDTPEVGQHAECGGDAARERLRAVLPEGTRVRTVADVQERDRYERWLLFLFTDDDAFVNLDLVRDGYAEALVIPPNVLWSGELEAAERDARAAGVGIWGAC